MAREAETSQSFFGYNIAQKAAMTNFNSNELMGSAVSNSVFNKMPFPNTLNNIPNDMVENPLFKFRQRP